MRAFTRESSSRAFGSGFVATCFSQNEVAKASKRNLPQIKAGNYFIFGCFSPRDLPSPWLTSGLSSAAVGYLTQLMCTAVGSLRLTLHPGRPQTQVIPLPQDVLIGHHHSSACRSIPLKGLVATTLECDTRRHRRHSHIRES